jgi:hypothetical protein
LVWCALAFGDASAESLTDGVKGAGGVVEGVVVDAESSSSQLRGWIRNKLLSLLILRSADVARGKSSGLLPFLSFFCPRKVRSARATGLLATKQKFATPPQKCEKDTVGESSSAGKGYGGCARSDIVGRAYAAKAGLSALLRPEWSAYALRQAVRSARPSRHLQVG